MGDAELGKSGPTLVASQASFVSRFCSVKKLRVFLGIRISVECCLGAPVTQEAVRSWLAGWFRQHGGSLPSPLACRVVRVTQRLPALFSSLVFLSLRTTVLGNP